MTELALFYFDHSSLGDTFLWFNLYFPNYIEHLLSVYLSLILIMLGLSLWVCCHSYKVFRKMTVQIFYPLYSYY